MSSSRALMSVVAICLLVTPAVFGQNHWLIDGCPGLGVEWYPTNEISDSEAAGGVICCDDSTLSSSTRCSDSMAPFCSNKITPYCSKSTVASATYCGENDILCPANEISTTSTYAQAKEWCEGQNTPDGARLCTSAEIQSGVACESGCGYGGMRVWTSDDDGTCKPWCGSHTATWDQKCTEFTNCKGCAECAELQGVRTCFSTRVTGGMVDSLKAEPNPVSDLDDSATAYQKCCNCGDLVDFLNTLDKFESWYNTSAEQHMWTKIRLNEIDLLRRCANKKCSSASVQLLETTSACLSPDDLDSWNCDCYATALSYCNTLSGDDKTDCLNGQYCKSDHICPDWKTANCPSEELLQVRAQKTKHKTDELLALMEDTLWSKHEMKAKAGGWACW